MANDSLRWGVLGSGWIAGLFADGVAHAQLGRVVAVGSRTLEKAEKFAADHGIAKAHGSYEALLADPEVQAVYIATPHPQHVEWVIRAAEAGKHVLCEKPIGLNHAEAMVAAEACREHDVLLMEAFMYRCHPQTKRVVEIIRDGTLGNIGLVQATFSFRMDYQPGHRLWANELAGGGILDVGCYPVSFARLVAGVAEGKPFADPVQLTGTGQLFPETGVDVVAAATLRFASGMLAQVSCGVGLVQDNSVRIYGEKGWLHVPEPWIPPHGGGATTLWLHRAGATAPEGIVVENIGWLYGLEADAFAVALAGGAREVPEMSVADTLGNMAALDAWRAAAGLVYESEKPENLRHTHARRPLARRAETVMRYAEVPGIARPVSRLVMGCDNQRTMPASAAMWDDWFERGGNAFDTAWLYGAGIMEKLLGHWMKHRGVRDDVVLIGKGGHTPYCTPEGLTRQLQESLERLQADRVEFYFLHRDNPAVPVGEFVDVLNEHVQAGRIKVFGGSNWSIARVQAANRYAKRKGLPGFGALSNQFSLARMVEPPWGGCLSASDADSRKWLKKTRTPFFAWSSQARGFFTGRAAPEQRDDADLVRCWYADDNWQRRERAFALAREKGVSAVAIAGAYVLHQPFPSFALIGPRTIAETKSSLDALRVELTPREVAWLNLEREKR